VYRTVTSHSTQICTRIATRTLNISLSISLKIITIINKQNKKNESNWSYQNQLTIKYDNLFFLCCRLTLTEIPHSLLKQKTVHYSQLFYSIQSLQNSTNLHSWLQSVTWIGILSNVTCKVLKRDWLVNGCLFKNMRRNLTLTQSCLCSFIQHNRTSQPKINIHIDILFLLRIFIRRSFNWLLCKKDRMRAPFKNIYSFTCHHKAVCVIKWQQLNHNTQTLGRPVAIS
jgi:hypothetical protein